MRSIADRIAEKVVAGNRQADRVIVDLRGSSVTRAELQSYIRANPIAGLQELRVIHTGMFGQVRIGQGM